MFSVIFLFCFGVFFFAALCLRESIHLFKKNTSRNDSLSFASAKTLWYKWLKLVRTLSRKAKQIKSSTLIFTLLLQLFQTNFNHPHSCTVKLSFGLHKISSRLSHFDGEESCFRPQLVKDKCNLVFFLFTSQAVP